MNDDRIVGQQISTNCVYCGMGEPQLIAKCGLQEGWWHVDCGFKLANEMALRNLSLLEQMKGNNEAMKKVNAIDKEIDEKNAELTLKNAELQAKQINEEGHK